MKSKRKQGGSVAKASKALLEKEKINENQNIPFFRGGGGGMAQR